MIESQPIPQAFEAAYNTLPRHTRYWLELDNEERPGTDLSLLTFNAFSLMLLPENKGRKWSIKRLKHHLDIQPGRKWPKSYLEEAATLAVYEFIEKGILGDSSDRWFSGDQIGRGSRFVLRKGSFTRAEGFSCLIAAGEAGGLDRDTLEELRQSRDQIRSTFNNFR